MSFEVDHKANEKKEKESKMKAKDGEFQQEFRNSLNHTILSEVASIKLYLQKYPKYIISIYVFSIVGNL